MIAKLKRFAYILGLHIVAALCRIIPPLLLIVATMWALRGGKL